MSVVTVPQLQKKVDELTNNFINSLTICNIIISLKLDIQHIDLVEVVARCCPCCYWCPDKFCAVIIRGHSDCKLFVSGKVVCTGNNTMVDTLYTCEGVVKILREKAGLDAYIVKTKLHNMVVKLNTGFDLNLDKLCKSLVQVGNYTAYYNPQNFPGCTFRSNNKIGCSMTFFQQGNVIVTGFRQFEDIKKSLCTIFRKFIIHAAANGSLDSGERSHATPPDKDLNITTIPPQMPRRHRTTTRASINVRNKGVPHPYNRSNTGLQWRNDSVKAAHQLLSDINIYQQTFS